MNDIADMPEEHEEFGGGIGRARIGGVVDPLQPIETTATSELGRSESTAKVLVCEECVEYYEHRADWQCCPKCGEEFTEVEKA